MIPFLVVPLCGVTTRFAAQLFGGNSTGLFRLPVPNSKIFRNTGRHG